MTVDRDSFFSSHLINKICPFLNASSATHLNWIIVRSISQMFPTDQCLIFVSHMHFQMLEEIVILEQNEHRVGIGQGHRCLCQCDQTENMKDRHDWIRIVNDYCWVIISHRSTIKIRIGQRLTSFEAKGRRTPIEPDKVV